MRSRSFAIVALLLGMLLAGVGAVYAYDSSRPQTIAKGISVAGIDVGGMSKQQARSRLRAEYLHALRRPVIVHREGQTWRLTAKQSHLGANITAMVDDAAARSDEGNILSRSWRRLTGGQIHADLSPRVTFSTPAIDRLVARVGSDVDRAPVDAKMSFDGPSGFTTVQSVDGRRLQADRLRKAIRESIGSPEGDRRFTAQVVPVKPKVTTQSIVQANATVLVVDRENFQLKLFRNLKLAKAYTVAVGQQGLETPAGLYHIQNKAISPAWHVPLSKWTGKLAGKVIPGGAPDNPIKARWMGIFDGAGIHGVDPSEYSSLGHAASHGCVRMRIDDVEELYPQVPVGAPIYIA